MELKNLEKQDEVEIIKKDYTKCMYICQKYTANVG